MSVLRRTTVTLTGNDHGNSLQLEALLGDGSVYEMQGVNTGQAGNEVELGRWEFDSVRWRFSDLQFNETWTEPDTSHIQRTEITGSNYEGFRYGFDDSGGFGTPDADFDDLIVEVHYYYYSMGDMSSATPGVGVEFAPND